MRRWRRLLGIPILLAGCAGSGESASVAAAGDPSCLLFSPVFGRPAEQPKAATAREISVNNAAGRRHCGWRKPQGGGR